jgi:hypothetical protein
MGALRLSAFSILGALRFPFFYFKLDGHLGWKSGSSDTNLEGGHPRTIPPNLVAIGPVVSEEKINM